MATRLRARLRHLFRSWARGPRLPARPQGRNEMPSAEVELAVFGAAHECVPLVGREDQHRTGRVLRVPYSDRLVDKSHFDTVVAAWPAPRALLPHSAAQVQPEPLCLDFHNGSLVNFRMRATDSSGRRAAARM